ncbi:5'-nucleotidase C-terminal domain-containing protein [Nocardioides sp. GXZ039]|uniref:5'-nucleotidase C-terminal domain-containing protein n=1 Tax=Nocardioides sp. GXZ039 TaxID=3136018 RepID=UPI0030F49728
MSRLSPLRRRTRSWLLGLTCAALGVVGAAAVPAQAASDEPGAVGDTMIGWAEIEDGVIAGNPGWNQGDHGNFSGRGSYTFRETGMSSTMSINAPEAGTYPLYIRYAAGDLSAAENVPRSMGLTVNGARQQITYPLTGDEYGHWETWGVYETTVPLNQGANSISINCDRSVDFCRLNFDAIQVGGTEFDPCAPTSPKPGYTALFDGTFASFDGWRKHGSGGFGRQTDCTIRGFRGLGGLWTRTQQNGPHTLEVQWRRGSDSDNSAVFLAASRGPLPLGGINPATDAIRIPIGTDANGATTGAIVVGGVATAPDADAVAAAVKPAGEWNTYRISVAPSQVQVFLNDTLVATRPGDTRYTGYIGLENRASGDDVKFRGIQVLDDYSLASLGAPATRATLLDGSENLGGESTLANLAAEAQRATTTANVGTAPAQLSFVDPGVLKGDLAAGALTFKQVAGVQPSATTSMRKVLMTGAQIENVLEQQWRSEGLLRLGTSKGFRYTYDPAQADGSRITGMWLDGTALVPTKSYSVTVSSALKSAASGFTFPSTGDKSANKTEQAALVEYLSDDVTPDTTQHAVGVSFPAGSSVLAGETLDLDLSSLAFSGAADPKDAEVEVSLGGASLGTFPVDNTLGDVASDEYGTAHVSVDVPAGTPVGPASLTVTGAATGTEVSIPFTVAAPPAVASTTVVTVSPGSVPVKQGKATVTVTVASSAGAPTGQAELYVDGVRTATLPVTGGKASGSVGPFATVGNHSVSARFLGSDAVEPSASAAVTVVATKAAATVRTTVQPKRVIAKKTRAKVKVQVSTAGFTPTGVVAIKIGKRTYTAKVVSGVATVKLAKFAKAGKYQAKVTYRGDALTSARTSTVRIKVVRR